MDHTGGDSPTSTKQLILVEFKDEDAKGKRGATTGDDSGARNQHRQIPHLELVDSNSNPLQIVEIETSVVVPKEDGSDDDDDDDEVLIPISCGGLTHHRDPDPDKERAPELRSETRIIYTEEKDEVEAEAPQSVPGKCCNCSSEITDEGTNLQEELTFRSYQTATKTMGSVTMKILDALAVLFVGKACDQEYYATFKSRDDLYMCSECISTFLHLHQLFNEFVSLSAKTNSILANLMNWSSALEPPHTKTGHSQKNKSLNGLHVETAQESSDRRNNIPKSIRKINSYHNSASVIRKKKRASMKKMKSGKSATKILKKKKAKSSSRPFTKSSSETKDDSDKFPDAVHIRALLNSDPVNFKALETSVALVELKKQRNKTNKAQTDSLVKRENDCTNKSDLECDRCGKCFKTCGGLKVHYASHVREDNKFACKDCGKKFRKQEALELHERIDHKGFKPHKCPHPGCDRNFRLRDKLRLHIKVMHERLKPFPCPKCEKSFRTKYHLKIHDVSQHIQGDESIGCSQCKRKFSTREGLETHVKTHDEEKPFICPKCGKGFHSSTRLKLHTKSHEKTPSSLCSICGKAYKHVRDLRLHEVTHQDESTYRFACGDCPKKFYRIDLLRVHQSNEKHFAPELIGPSISKAEGITSKYKVPSEDEAEFGSDEESSLASPQKTFRHKRKPKSTAPSKSRKRRRNSSHEDTGIGAHSRNPLICPSAVTVLQANAPELEEESPVGFDSTNMLTYNNHSLSQRISHDIPGPATLIVSSRDRVINLQPQSASSNCSLTLHQPSAIPSGANSIYTIRDLNDKSISTFSISAEQIGFDVINAFMNNLH